jgi:hypothetical protein
MAISLSTTPSGRDAASYGPFVETGSTHLLNSRPPSRVLGINGTENRHKVTRHLPGAHQTGASGSAASR